MDPHAPNPYDYILNPPSNSSKPAAFNPKNKLLFSVLFVVGVLVLVVIVISIFSALTKKDYSSYISLAGKQTEIVRVADLGLTKARSTDTKNYIATIRQTIQSEKNETVKFLVKNKRKVNEKQLLLARNSETDKALAAAENSSTYDETLIRTINQLVTSYQKSAKDATKSPSGPSEKALATRIRSDTAILSNAK